MASISSSASSQQQQQQQQADRVKVEQIASEFFAKCLHIILESRIPDIHGRIQGHGVDDGSCYASWSGGSSGGTRGGTNTWFNMELHTCTVAAEAAEPWRRSGLAEPMVVDVHVLQAEGRDGGCAGSVSPFREERVGTLLERWIVQYDRQERRTRSELGGKEEVSARVSISKGESQSLGRTGGSAGPKPSVQGLGMGMKGSVEVPLVYKRAVIMLRTLYCTARTLPAYRLFRRAKNSSLNRSFTLAFRVSAVPPDLTDLDQSAMTPYTFSPIETPDGRMCVSVAYRHTSAVTASDVTPSIVPKIILDYVGSPTTDPLRRFSSSPHPGSAPNGGISKRRGMQVASLPSSPSGANLGRRHSWSGGANKVPGSSLPSPTVRNISKSPSPVHPSDFPLSPPQPPSPRPASSPLGNAPSPRSSPSDPHHARNYPSQLSSLHHTSQPIPVLDRQRSPRFSPSPSPSPPNPSLPHDLRYSSAPVSIPRSAGRSPRILPPSEASQLHSRNSLPPQSPKSRDLLTRTLWTNSRQYPEQVGTHSPSEGKMAARLYITSLAGSSLLVSPPQPYGSNQFLAQHGEDGAGVAKLLSGHSGLMFSNSAAKGADFEDEDEELVCPFAVDDEEVDGYRSRLDGPHWKPKAGHAFESIGHGVGSYHRSEDAAVGALVKILKTAPPLRQSSYGYGFQSDAHLSKRGAGEVSAKGEFWVDPLSGPEFAWGTQPGGRRTDATSATSPGGALDMVGSHQLREQTGSHILKTAADALEEFRGYKEMKEHLLRQSGGTLVSSQSAVQL